MDASPKFLDALRVLVGHEVEFIVVGGVAAILEGAPISTFDLDIMHRREEANYSRLLEALTALDAVYLDPAGRTIRPDLGKLRSFRLHRLITSAGPLDLLTEIDPGWTYDDLAEQTVTYEVDGLSVRVVQLEIVIQSKRQAHRDKDKAALPVLQRALELKRQRDV
jgi:predicted nucleotidyltransferase